MQTTQIEKIQKNSERITILETQIKPVLEDMEQLTRDVHAIRIKVEKSASFIGGFSFAMSLVGSAVVAIVAWALHKTGVM